MSQRPPPRDPPDMLTAKLFPTDKSKPFTDKTIVLETLTNHNIRVNRITQFDNCIAIKYIDTEGADINNTDLTKALKALHLTVKTHKPNTTTERTLLARQISDDIGSHSLKIYAGIQYI